MSSHIPCAHIYYSVEYILEDEFRAGKDMFVLIAVLPKVFTFISGSKNLLTK